jgi:hypothetical protein
VPIEKAKLRVGHNLDPRGDETLVLRGRLQLVTLTPQISPVLNGFLFTVYDHDGTALFTRAIPGGTPPPGGGAGWIVNSRGTRAVYKDLSGTVVSGITRAAVANPRAINPGRFTFSVRGKLADFQVAAAALPVQVSVVLGGAVQAGNGQCGTRAFNSAGSVAPVCSLSRAGDVLTCR